MKANNNQNIESVIICNKQVENLLPDKPSRIQVLEQIDNIKSLQVQKRNLTIYIHNKDSMEYFKNFFYAANGKIIKDSQPVFYYEVPTVLYNWLNSHSLKDLTDQISFYIAYCNHLVFHSTVLSRHFYDSPIFTSILKANSAIKNCDISKKDLLRYRHLIKKHLYGVSRKIILYTVKYWKLSEKYLKHLPIDPLLCINSVENSEWGKIYENYGFKYKAYMTYKGYGSIENNRLSIMAGRSGDGYSDKFLDLWKYFYINNSISEKLINNIYCKNLRAVHYFKNESKLCDFCGDDIGGLLFEFGEVKESKPLCIECYLWEYFE